MMVYYMLQLHVLHNVYLLIIAASPAAPQMSGPQK